MRMQGIVGLTFLAFVVQSTIVPWIIPGEFAGRIVPHFTLAVVLFAAMYHSRHSALLLGAGFGLLQDVVFRGHLLGLHAYAMALIGYLFGLLLERRRSTMMMALVVVAFGTLLYELALYYVYKVFQFTQESLSWALVDHILPSLFLQLAFALAVYIPLRRWFQNLAMNRYSKKEPE
ncbi:rod shape-determining protein MreD [Paenibacillus humicus]|uniref:rod shape-determining protein MreD n=1 Tax=Paenibacillus humicus TaxID=412861 RepID=UPI000FD76DA0|nr:rod shape-determining protein MreD [Paenibacillus humicus]